MSHHLNTVMNDRVKSIINYDDVAKLALTWIMSKWPAVDSAFRLTIAHF